jgi:hypothetical protein
LTLEEKDAELKRVTMLSELRNGLQQAVTALDEYLNSLGNQAAQAARQGKKLEWTFANITWVESQGSKGTYMKATKQESPDYTSMIIDLKAQNGKLTKQGEFYWLFSDNETVGRKPAKK